MKPLFSNRLAACICAAAAAVAPVPAIAASPDSGVVLINPFEAGPGREAECLAMWNRAADLLRTKPGFRSTALHESMSPEARFRYVNVAVWESPQAFQAAVSDPAFRAATATDACTGSPALYKVITLAGAGR